MKSSNNSRVSKILARSKELAKKGLTKSKELVKKGVEKSKQLSKDDKLVTDKDKKHHRREQELEVVAEAAEYHLHPNPFHYAVYQKGGTTNYTKKWKVVGIDMFGKKFETLVTLGRMSNQDDVKNSIKRMPNLKVRQITMIKEVMAKGGEINEQEELKKIIKEDYPKFIELLGENIKDVKFRKLVVELAQKNAVKYDVIDVECEKLIPTQNEISINNSLFYPLTIKKCTEQYFNGDKVPIKIQGNTLVTCDNGHYIIDGHHRWSQVYVINPKAKMVCTDFYQLKSPLMGLKATQLGISADLGYLPIQKVEDTNMLTASEETIKKYIREVITDECREVFIKNGVTDPEEHIWKNVVLMKKHNMPIKNASKRDLMPQTDMAKDFAKFTPKISKLADGGTTDGMETVNYLRSISGLRANYIAQWADTNNVNLYKLSQAIKLKKVSATMFSDALMGKQPNKLSNLLIATFSNRKMADGGILIPQQGTLYTKDKKSKLEYYKKGNDYAFKVYDVENNPVENYTRNQYKKRSDEEALMTYNQFINYLYSELYIDDKMAMGGEMMADGGSTNEFKIEFNENDKNRGKIITPYYYEVYGYRNPIQLEVNFSELYKRPNSQTATYSFAKYGICQFTIKSDNINSAIELAIQRLKDIFKNGIPNRNDKFIVSGFRYDETNKKVSYTPSFMENTHLRNQFTEDSFKTKKGDLLKHDTEGDGYDFWYAIDNDGKRISDRLKGSILIGFISDGVLITKPKMAMGGETTFDDKVKAVKSSLLKRKKVAPQVQKDYGKTYSPKEAEQSAKRIVGSQVSKWKERMGKK